MSSDSNSIVFSVRQDIAMSVMIYFNYAIPCILENQNFQRGKKEDTDVIQNVVRWKGDTDVI